MSFCSAKDEQEEVLGEGKGEGIVGGVETERKGQKGNGRDGRRERENE